MMLIIMDMFLIDFSYDVIEDYNMHIQTIGKELGNHRVSVLSCVVFPLLILEFSESC